MKEQKRLTDEEIVELLDVSAERGYEVSGTTIIKVDTYPLLDAQITKVSPVIARLEAEKKELTRKGEELCCFGGNLLIEKHDLEKHIAELEEKALREFEKLMDLASRYDELEAENKRLKNSLQELYNAHIKYQSSVDCEAPDEHLVMMDKAGKLLEAGEQGKGE